MSFSVRHGWSTSPWVRQLGSTGVVANNMATPYQIHKPLCSGLGHSHHFWIGAKPCPLSSMQAQGPSHAPSPTGLAHASFTSIGTGPHSLPLRAGPHFLASLQGSIGAWSCPLPSHWDWIMSSFPPTGLGHAPFPPWEQVGTWLCPLLFSPTFPPPPPARPFLFLGPSSSFPLHEAGSGSFPLWGWVWACQLTSRSPPCSHMVPTASAWVPA